MFPRTFSSQKEYDSYIYCLSKAKVGDIAKIYIEQYGIADHVTAQTVSLTIIGIGIYIECYCLLLGSNTYYSAMWRIKSNRGELDDLRLSILNFDDFEYAWWPH